MISSLSVNPTPPTSLAMYHSSQTIYRVVGVTNYGQYWSHLVGANSAQTAMASVLAADSRLTRIVSAKPVNNSEVTNND